VKPLVKSLAYAMGFQTLVDSAMFLLINQCISPMFNPYLNGLVITCHPTKKNETHLLPPVVTRLIPQGGAASIAAQLLSELH